MKNFNTTQLDALKEVSNIGAGNAATALASMLNKKVDMTVPAVNVIKLEQLYNLSNENEAVAIIIRVLGDAPGNILILFEEDSAKDVIKSLTGMDEGPLSQMGSSVLCEIGNIISASYMNAIAQFTRLNMYPSVPGFSYDMVGAILSTAFVEVGQFDEYILDIETVFLDGVGKNLGTHFYYIPVPGALEKILESLGVN
ncbi:MAG: chemotaxis protein CheC [Clostridium sp.]